MKKKMFLNLFISFIVLFMCALEVDAVGLYNRGLITGWGAANQTNRYYCPGKDWGVEDYAGVLRIASSSVSYYCTDCTMPFASISESADSTSYNYTANDKCYYTCDNLSGFSSATGDTYAENQHYIWDEFANFDYIDCDYTNDDLLDACGGDTVYILREFEYEEAGYQDVVQVVQETPEEDTSSTITVRKTCSGVSGSYSFTVNGSSKTISCGGSAKWTVEAGTYTITENNVPANTIVTVQEGSGAITQDNKITVTVSESDSTTVNFNNSLATGGIKITKVNELGAKVSGVKFKLLSVNGTEKTEAYYYNTSTPVGELVTDSNGEINISNLNFGTYEVVETYNPNPGYVLASPQTVTIDKVTTPIAQVKFINTPIKIKLVKTDFSGNTTLGGSNFIIYDKTTLETFTELTTKFNEDSYIPLIPGEYTITEIQAPSGYDILQENFDIKVLEDGTITLTGETNEYVTLTKENDEYILKVKNDTKKVIISKQDVSTKQELEGAVFKLTTEDGTLIEEWTTTTTPKRLDLSTGTYILIEETAPKGYEKITKTLKFSVNDDKTVVLEENTDNNIFVANENMITIYNSKPITIPDTGVVGKIALIATGVALLGGGGYIIAKKVKKGKK